MSSIRKNARSELYKKIRSEKKMEKKRTKLGRREEERIFFGSESNKKRVPKTIDNQRVKNDTFFQENDLDISGEIVEDEFASYFVNSTDPKVVLTTSRKPSQEMFRLLQSIFSVIPNAYYYARRSYYIEEIIRHSNARGFTDILVFNENRKFSKGAKINGLLHIHLPVGPTCLYRLSSLVYSEKIRNHGRSTTHHPELILNNFSTRLGHRIGRMFASIFPQRPEFKGRRVVTFHNQRDFIFFRHHRYVFEVRNESDEDFLAKFKADSLCESEQDLVQSYTSAELTCNTQKNSESKNSQRRERAFSDAFLPVTEIKSDAHHQSRELMINCKHSIERQALRARLQELGPRFTLKLLSIQKGTFNSKHGEYEYVFSGDAGGSKYDRRKFVL
tara:strand:- start:1687 stop:2850 length:1164 start_codon:yes stop_codon:yes gene_type:complete|mmetsp:Transcript_1668/g.5518  ORF Transcript_1668/g.5518 Transcript_1668/m.5518 type:complete len:388 (-) Transcript_1668:784-1947(-)